MDCFWCRKVVVELPKVLPNGPLALQYCGYMVIWMVHLRKCIVLMRVELDIKYIISKRMWKIVELVIFYAIHFHLFPFNHGIFGWQILSIIEEEEYIIDFCFRIFCVYLKIVVSSLLLHLQ